MRAFYPVVWVLAALVFAAPALVSAQRARDAPPYEASKNFISLKAFGTPTFLLWSGQNVSFGFEYSFRKRHSIGATFTYNQLASKKSYNDSIQEALGDPYRHYVDRGWMVYYRYYAAGWWAWSAATFRPYLSGFVRAGNGDAHYDKNYESDQVKYDERQLSAGALVGFTLPLDGALCIDANIGSFCKWKSMRDEHLYNGVTTVGNSAAQNWGLKVGLTLAYVRGR